MENLNNFFTKKEDPIVEEVLLTEPAVEEAPVAEPVVEPVVETTPEPVKVEETKEENTAIKTTDFGRSNSQPQAVGTVADGAIGVTTAEPKPAKKSAAKKPAKEDTVAIFSTRNVTWEGVGKVYRGYNIVAKDAADKWLTRNHIRMATPEEVAKEFGK